MSGFQISPLHGAKERLRIPELWKLRQWPGEPGQSCPCPYRPDRTASGSVFKDGLLFKDFASDEVMDAPALLAKTEGLNGAEACKLFIELAGVQNRRAPAPLRTRTGFSRPQKAPPVKPQFPPLSPFTKSDVRKLAESREVSIDAVLMACDAGLVRKCRWRGFWCWAVTDSAGWVAQLRRFDRRRFPVRDNEGEGPKAWTLKGGRAGWPVGIAGVSGVSRIALVEGGPDLIAAFHFIAAKGLAGTVAPVAMLGASARIVDDALPSFRGKRVRIFCHADPPKTEGRSAGIEAAFRWQAQLTAAGATVDTFDLSGLRKADGQPVNDLNDLVRCHPDDWQREAAELENLMHF